MHMFISICCEWISDSKCMMRKVKIELKTMNRGSILSAPSASPTTDFQSGIFIEETPGFSILSVGARKFLLTFQFSIVDAEKLNTTAKWMDSSSLRRTTPLTNLNTPLASAWWVRKLFLRNSTEGWNVEWFFMGQWVKNHADGQFNREIVQWKRKSLFHSQDSNSFQRYRS